MRVSLIVALASIAILLALATPVSAAPPGQAAVSSFSLSADATLTVTLVLTNGQTLVVPVDVQVVANHQNGTTEVALVADADPQPGMQIAVESSPPAMGTLQFEPPAASPIPTVTPQTTGVPAEVSGAYVVVLAGNLRGGPGTSYPIVGTVQVGDELMVAGQNEDGSWLQLADGSWIAAFLVSPAEEAPPSPRVTLTPVATPVVPLPTATALPAIPAATPAADIEAILEELATSNSELANALVALAELLAAPRPLNPTWRAEVAAQAAIVLASLEEVEQLPPIPGYEDLQAQVVATVEVCTTAAGYMAAGLESLSPAELVAATQSISACSTQAAALATTLEQLQP